MSHIMIFTLEVVDKNALKNFPTYMTPQLMYTSELLTFTGNIMIFTLVLVDKYALKILPTLIQ